MRREFKDGDILALEPRIIELIENKENLPFNGIGGSYKTFERFNIYGKFKVRKFNYYKDENECHDITLSVGSESRRYDVSWFRLADEMIEAEDF